MPTPPVIAYTPGEPAGVGPDLCLALAQQRLPARVVVLADRALVRERAQQLGGQLDLPGWANQGAPGLYVRHIPLDAPVSAGRLDPRNSTYVLRTLDAAIDGCRNHDFAALVTGPVHKGIINDAGIAFTGHTEYLAARTHTPQPVMMLAAPGRSPSAAKRRDARERPPDLRVSLATTHLPLAEVPRVITRERLTAVLRVLHTDLQRKFGIAAPHILVLGLNPHAGEGGHLGREEIEVIEPVLNALRAEGLQLKGPVPADTAFLPATLAGIDAVLAMYHDQGLPVLKHHDFAHAVNITLGLPFVRTSVDHGTALELAGSGRADASSLLAAMAMALALVRHTPNAFHTR
jgi:4-hydroxythreonine-4-phosphate dehydrogenase